MVVWSSDKAKVISTDTVFAKPIYPSGPMYVKQARTNTIENHLW